MHLGGKILPCIFATLKQAKYLNADCDVYLLADEVAYQAFEENYKDKLTEEGIELINMKLIPKSQEHLAYVKVDKINPVHFDGLWTYALRRFFYLYDFMCYKNMKNVVHLESDSMLYVNLAEILPFFETANIRMAAPFQSTVGCIPCFVFIKDSISFGPLIHHIISEMVNYQGERPHIDVNDMQVLASFYRNFGSSYFTPLPILMPEYGRYHSKRLSNFEPDNQTSLEFLSINASLFPGYIFDAAALGVFANGNDRRYFPTHGPGSVHYRSIFDPGHFSFFWGEDEQRRKVPYCSFHENTYRIVNMHFHSKMPEEHTSYGESRAEFQTQSHPCN